MKARVIYLLQWDDGQSYEQSTCILCASIDRVKLEKKIAGYQQWIAVKRKKFPHPDLLHENIPIEEYSARREVQEAYLEKLKPPFRELIHDVEYGPRSGFTIFETPLLQ